MLDVGPEIQALERRSYEIVGMICGGAVADPEIDAAIADFEAEAAVTFESAPRAYDRIYGRRFRRLRRWFHPRAELFEAVRATVT